MLADLEKQQAELPEIEDAIERIKNNDESFYLKEEDSEGELVTILDSEGNPVTIQERMQQLLDEINQIPKEQMEELITETAVNDQDKEKRLKKFEEKGYFQPDIYAKLERIADGEFISDYARENLEKNYKGDLKTYEDNIRNFISNDEGRRKLGEIKKMIESGEYVISNETIDIIENGEFSESKEGEKEKFLAKVEKQVKAIQSSITRKIEGLQRVGKGIGEAFSDAINLDIENELEKLKSDFSPSKINGFIEEVNRIISEAEYLIYQTRSYEPGDGYEARKPKKPDIFAKIMQNDKIYGRLRESVRSFSRNWEGNENYERNEKEIARTRNGLSTEAGKIFNFLESERKALEEARNEMQAAIATQEMAHLLRHEIFASKSKKVIEKIKATGAETNLYTLNSFLKGEGLPEVRKGQNGLELTGENTSINIPETSKSISLSYLNRIFTIAEVKNKKVESYKALRRRIDTETAKQKTAKEKLISEIVANKEIPDSEKESAVNELIESADNQIWEELEDFKKEITDLPGLMNLVDQLKKPDPKTIRREIDMKVDEEKARIIKEAKEKAEKEAKLKQEAEKAVEKVEAGMLPEINENKRDIDRRIESLKAELARIPELKKELEEAKKAFEESEADYQKQLAEKTKAVEDANAKYEAAGRQWFGVKAAKKISD